MTIVAVVLLSVAVICLLGIAWFCFSKVYRVLLEGVLRAITGRRKPDYARIGELEASDPALPMPERLAARRKAAVEGMPAQQYAELRQRWLASSEPFRIGVDRLWTEEDTVQAIDEGVLTRIACANCRLYLKPCPEPACVRESPWVHLAGSHACPDTSHGAVALAEPVLFVSANGGLTWTLRGPVREN